MTAPMTKMFESVDDQVVLPRELVPQQRMGDPAELAGTILYLASRAGAYCNGQVMVLDGGFLHTHGEFLR